MATKKQLTETDTVDEILGSVIDEWYERVAGFYATEDNVGDSDDEIELKRFHDERGHRIKFNKEELDFTYGLKNSFQELDLIIEISVNNKVANFDYVDFKKRLVRHYKQAGRQPLPTPYELRSYKFREIFELRPSLDEAFSVEKREGKADIMRLAFRIGKDFVGRITSHPVAARQLIDQYCVSPFRSVFATVYRSR